MKNLDFSKMDLEFPVIKWNHGNEYAVMKNNLAHKNIKIIDIPKKDIKSNVVFLKEFDDIDEAFKYQEMAYISKKVEVLKND